MNRPVVPLVYAATARPLPSITRCTGALEPTPAAHTVDVTASRIDSSKGPPRIHMGSEPDHTIMRSTLGVGAAAEGGGSALGAGTSSA